MKDFMLVFIGKNYADLNLSPEQSQERMQAWMSWHQKMEEAGTVKSGEALQGKVRSISGPERTVTDRAATELKELIGGFYIVQAEDYEGASEIAQDYPDYDLGGTVIIREVFNWQNLGEM